MTKKTICQTNTGRPVGDVRKAMLAAVQDAPGSTTQELAQRACVGMDAARRAMDNLRRAGAVVRGVDRAVAYRNRPVATWLPANGSAAAMCCLSAALRAWG